MESYKFRRDIRNLKANLEGVIEGKVLKFIVYYRKSDDPSRLRNRVPVGISEWVNQWYFDSSTLSHERHISRQTPRYFYATW